MFNQIAGVCGDGVAKFLNFLDFNIAPPLLYYAYVPILVVNTIFGFFILKQNKSDILNRLLFYISLFFSFWILNIFLQWIALPNKVIYIAWELTAFFELPVFLFSVYFIENFINKGDFNLKKKRIFLYLLFIPVIFFLFTRLNIQGYDYEECEGTLGPLWLYIYFIEFLSILWILVSGFLHFKKEFKNNQEKRKVFIITIGVVIFLSFFSLSNIVGEISGDYEINLVGPIGVVLFLGLVNYIIVKYKTFNAKLFGAQALVLSLVLFIGSQFFFITVPINFVLTGITFIIVIIFGYFLVKSVKKEIQTREQIETLAQDLSKANVRLKELDQQKSEFISLASHQIRGPLASIKGYVSMILEGDFGLVKKDLKDIMETIFSSTQSLVVLVGDFLDISRIEQGRMKYDYTDFNLEELAKTAVREIEPTVEIKKLGISFVDAQKGDYMVHADQGKMKQIILNIIDNSIKYTKEGSIKIGIERKNNKIHLSVKDTGVGIAPEVLPKLFEKFTRAPDASKTNILGTGLGLYVAKKMIEAQDGRIWAVSEGVGKGSEFHIELNAKNRDTEAELPSGVKNFAKDL